VTHGKGAGPLPGSVTVVVLAKAPAPGRSKTRLTPAYSPAEAAALAAAALADTLAVVAATPHARPVLALDGLPGRWLPAGVPVLPQRGAGLDERIAAALADAVALRGAPVLLVGMDTPQLTPALLTAAARALTDADAVLGPAADGGWWLLGLHAVDPALLLGVPMSTATTGRAQRARLAAAGLRVADLPVLRDVDTPADARAVAAAAPGTRFAALVAALADARGAA